MAMRFAASVMVTSLAFQGNASALEKYVHFELTAAGDQLTLTLSNGSYRNVPRDTTQFDDAQATFDQPAIAPHGLRVGWLALYPNFGTSYPLPLNVVIYRNGKIEARFYGDGQPIFRWRFSETGDSVFFCQRPAHGEFPGHYVRQKIGKKLPEEEMDRNDDDTTSGWPAWAASVRC